MPLEQDPDVKDETTEEETDTTEDATLSDEPIDDGCGKGPNKP